MLKYFGARSSSSFATFEVFVTLFSLDKGLQFISIGIEEDESGLVCLFDFFDLDFFGGLLYFDLDLDFSSLELLSFFSFCSSSSLGEEEDLFICLSFSFTSSLLISLISFSLSSGLIKFLLSIFSLFLFFSFSSFFGSIIFSLSFSILLSIIFFSSLFDFSLF